MGYAKEFNFGDYVIPAYLQKGDWQDVSYHNDVCPRFENHNLLLAVWVDHIDPEQREYEDWKQYTVAQLIPQNKEEFTIGDDSLFATESMTMLEDWLKMYEIKQLVDKANGIANTLHEQPEELADGLVSTLEWLNTYMKPE